MSDVETGLATSEPAGLDAILDKQLEGYGESAPETVAPAEEPPELKVDATGRAHGKDGKFASKEPAAEAPQGSAETATPAAPIAAVPDPALAQPVEAPARFTAEQKAEFSKLPPEAQKILTARIKEGEADYTRKTQEAADIRRTAEPLLNAVKPFEQYLTQIAPIVGRNPPDMIAGLLATEYQLRTGTPEQKYQALHQIAGSYGIDLGALARGEVAQPDPTITQLRQQNQTLEQRLNQIEQEANQRQQQQLNSTIEAFTQAKDEAGKPKYPHYERVKGIMAQALQQGEAQTLEEAYQKAVAPIQEAIAEELSARQVTADAQRQAAVAKAEKAAPVKSSGNQPGGVTKAKGLDAILDAAMSQHGLN